MVSHLADCRINGIETRDYNDNRFEKMHEAMREEDSRNGRIEHCLNSLSEEDSRVTDVNKYQDDLVTCDDNDYRDRDRDRDRELQKLRETAEVLTRRIDELQRDNTRNGTKQSRERFCNRCDNNSITLRDDTIIISKQKLVTTIILLVVFLVFALSCFMYHSSNKKIREAEYRMRRIGNDRLVQ